MLVAPASTTEPQGMQPHMSRPWIEMRLHNNVGPIIVQFAPRRQIPAHGISCAAFVSEPSSSGYSVIPWLRKIPCAPWRRKKNGLYKWHSQQFSVENSTCGSRYNSLLTLLTLAIRIPLSSAKFRSEKLSTVSPLYFSSFSQYFAENSRMFQKQTWFLKVQALLWNQNWWRVDGCPLTFWNYFSVT